MKKSILSVFVLVLAAISFDGCAAKAQKKVDEPYYDRANDAAREAHKRFDKE